ncbi:iron complex transport system permease protein [Pedococcus dokdonensis]|uniref:Iron complex transport system permease protein n=1 Tax=Pedococcus dokdonensis TaxID=443156 RepID=A0A1H0V256_9MICO|nr:iron chelate uptake ABC transporter family permease subunit [Pedococcus dokdonensis]SDP72423.1 iron complex transport system permease protein [Pedococcus dokdonensis]
MTLHPVVDRPTVAPRATVGRSVTPRWALLGLVAAVALGAVLSLVIGSRTVPLTDAWAAVTAYDPANPMQAIVAARVPRTVVALLAGAALGLAGASMQGLTRNPLADPGVLGINAGAALAMVLAISVFGVTSLSGYLWFALAGAALAAAVVHAIAGLGRDGATPVKLAVAGAALAAGLSSWTTGLLLTDRQTLDVFRFWQVGTVGGRSMDIVWPVLPVLVVGAALALTGARLLNVLALGDDLARGLGRRAGLDRVVVGLAIVCLCGGATALAGPLVFVGLVAPHVARALVGSDYARILPVSLGLGAVLVLYADVVGRVVLPPTEVQVGIMTAVVGVPVFFALIRRGRMGSL